MAQNFKAPRTPVTKDEESAAYIEHIKQKAEEEQLMQMYEHSLERNLL